MDDLTAEIVRFAVATARVKDIRDVDALRNRLTEEYPDNPAQCEQALVFWANNG